MAVAAKAQEAQQMLEREMAEIKKIEQEYAKVAQGKQQMMEKKSENEMVI